jgi:ABC-2 type transport system permease protein
MSATPLTARAERPGMGRLIKVETRKMLDTRAGLWLLIITALGAIGGMLAQSLGGHGADAEAASVFYTAAGVSSVLLPVIGVLLVTGEWSQRTGLFTFALVPARGRIVAAKFIAALLVAVVASALCLILGLLGGSLFGTGTEIDGAQIGQGFVFLAISVSIGVALGLLLQSSPLAIVTLFAGPVLIGAIGAISNSINDVTVWLDQSSFQTLVDITDSPEWGKIAVTALFWVALPLVLGMIRLERGDID